MTHYNPAIRENSYCVLVMNTPSGNFTQGFTVVGPFETEISAASWGEANIAGTPCDNPHWVVAPMMTVS